MSAITFYEPSGKIYAVLEGDDSVINLNKQMTQSAWIDGMLDSKVYYVVNGVATLRPVCAAQLDGLVLSNLPAPCVLDINGTSYNVDQAEVTLDLPTGASVVRVVAFPYLDGVFNVNN